MLEASSVQPLAHRLALGLACIVLSTALTPALAQEAPVPEEAPPDPPKPKKKAEPKKEDGEKPKRKVVTPGFDVGDSGEEPDDEEKKPKKPKGRDLGTDEPDWDEEMRKPLSVPEQGDNERLISDLNVATGEVTLGELLDEILADVVAELDRRPPRMFSPMAIRQVQLGANVVPTYSQKLQSAIVAQVHAGTKIRMVDCVECNATHTRLKDGEWVISRGVSTAEEMQSIGKRLGIRSFMDVQFGFDPETGVLEMGFRVIRAEDGTILWSDGFRADETTPILMRSSEAPMKRRDRLRDLEMLLEGRPYYGYMASAGFMLIPHDDPVEGDIGGATAGYRIYERFGPERQVMFGLDLQGFLNADRLAGAVISAGSWWVPIRPDLVNPELRLGAKAGAFVAGTAGNAAVFQLGAEVLLRYRFGLYGYVLFMTKSTFPPDTNQSLGGVGFSAGMSFNW